MLHDPLANVISVIKHADKIGKKECIVRPGSNLIRNVLNVMSKEGYIKDVKYIKDGKGGKVKIELEGKINDCKVIKPRHSIKKDEYVKWEKRFLPAVGIGIIIISTTKGVVSHKEVKDKRGGVLLAYVY
jgi:small subunit ribosomal protein S8